MEKAATNLLDIKDVYEQTKCGEVFRNERGRLSYLCFICTTMVEKAVDFEEHVVMHFEAYFTVDQYELEEPSQDVKRNFVNENVQTKQQQLQMPRTSPMDNREQIYLLEKLNLDNVEQFDMNNAMSKCGHCDQTFYCIGLKQQHNSQMHEHEKRAISYICTQCPASFDSQMDVDVHEKLHTDNSLPSIACYHCKQLFRSEYELGHHLNVTANLQTSAAASDVFHNIEATATKKLPNRPKRHRPKKCTRNTLHQTTKTKLECHDCGKKFCFPSGLNEHQKLHLQNKFHILKECDICGHQFKDRTNLIVHMRVHSGEKPYSCHICGKRFAQSSYVKIHVRMHRNERPYQCTVCGKCFVMTSQLTGHMKLHNNPDIRYTCTLCPQEYKRVGDLKTHLRKHSGERPFGCAECTRTFASRKVLNQHKKIHSGDRPFLCKYCGMGFTQSAGRRGHEKRVHEEIRGD